MIDGWDHPLCLLDDPNAYAAWQREVGAEEAQDRMNEACRAHMQQHGVRSILEVVEKMDDCSAVIGVSSSPPECTCTELSARARNSMDPDDHLAECPWAKWKREQKPPAQTREIGQLPCIQIVEQEGTALRVFVLDGEFSAESVVRHVRRVLEYPDDSDWTFWAKRNPAYYELDSDGLLQPSTKDNPEARRYWELEKCSIYDQ